MDIAYIFPGQGAQYIGMGEDFYQGSPAAKEVFDRANAVLGFDLAGLIFKGEAEELTRTLNSQVAIFTVSIAFLRALQAKEPAINVKYTAGLSLGEYSAIVAAEALGFEEALKLVRARAEYMEDASRKNPGGMVSLIGLDLNKVEEICAGSKAEIANLNCPGQVVISGSLPALKKAEELARKSGARKVIPLKVSGAFHSSLMAEASESLLKDLKRINICPARVPVVSNVTAKEEYSPEEIRDNLARQVVSRVRWEESIRFIVSRGVTGFLEIGPGKVLKGLLRKIDPSLNVRNIEKAKDLAGLESAG